MLRRLLRGASVRSRIRFVLRIQSDTTRGHHQIKRRHGKMRPPWLFQRGCSLQPRPLHMWFQRPTPVGIASLTKPNLKDSPSSLVGKSRGSRDSPRSRWATGLCARQWNTTTYLFLQVIHHACTQKMLCLSLSQISSQLIKGCGSGRDTTPWPLK